MWHRLITLATTTVDPRPVGLARILVGSAAAIEAIASTPRLIDVLAPGAMAAPFPLAVPRLPLGAAPWFMLLWLMAAIAFAVGWHTRWTGGVLAALIGYHQVLDQQTYSNHAYLMLWVVLLLMLADCGAAHSLDARRRGPRAVVPAWPVFLLRCQLTITYGFAVVAKLNSVYLSGAVLAVYMHRQYGPLTLPANWFDVSVLMPLAVLTVVVEAGLALALWVPRWRRPALLTGLALHTGIPLMFAGGPGAVGVLWLTAFSLLMAGLYATFWASPQHVEHDIEQPVIVGSATLRPTDSRVPAGRLTGSGPT